LIGELEQSGRVAVAFGGNEQAGGAAELGQALHQEQEQLREREGGQREVVAADAARNVR
jgi:hypothetical protein